MTKCVSVSNLSYKGKKSGCEVDCSVIVYWLVHPDQFFEGQAVRTLASKAKRRINVLEHVIHLRVINTAPEQSVVCTQMFYKSDILSARIIFGPDSDELVKMVCTENGGVPGEVVEVVHDDSDEEIEHEEAAEEDKGDEEEIGDVAAAHLAGLQQLARGLVPLNRPGVADLARPARQHDVWPRLPCSAPRHKRRGVR